MNNNNTLSEKRELTAAHRLFSFIGGVLLISRGLKNGSLLSTAVGGYLAYKGFAGNRSFNEVCNSVKKAATGQAINIRTHLVINKPRKEVYAAWRNLSNLPLFMKHLVKVEDENNQHSHWELQLPAGLGPLQWKAEIVKERTEELLAWQSIEGSSIQNAGKVEFRDALGNQGTAVDVVFSYHAPLGKAGEKTARLFTPVFRKMIHTDIQNFKTFVETGTSPVSKVVAIP